MDGINPFTLLLCWAPILMGVLIPALYFLSLIRATTLRSRIDREKADREARLMALKEAAELRREQLQEMEIARKNNAVVKQDLEIELLNLKIRNAQQDLKLRGLDGTSDFKPQGYDGPDQ